MKCSDRSVAICQQISPATHPVLENSYLEATMPSKRLNDSNADMAVQNIINQLPTPSLQSALDTFNLSLSKIIHNKDKGKGTMGNEMKDHEPQASTPDQLKVMCIAETGPGLAKSGYQSVNLPTVNSS